MEKKWKILSEPNRALVDSLSDELGIDVALSSLLVQRRINDFDQARHFFRPELEGLHNPFLMLDMDKAIQRLKKALDDGEKILVYGDYDVDGTTSVALVFSFLRQRTEKLGYYIPDRYAEGYGISFMGIEYALKNDYSLVIALDCGIKAVDKIAYAKKKGLDFIVCDHHLPGEELPDACAILDPRRDGCDYPYKELSGCGVGFKLLQGFCLRNGIPFAQVAQYLDLVCVSNAADLVPMTGENRILAYHGLRKLNEDPLPGLKALIQISNCGNKLLSVSDLVFKICPRLNAAGRISSGASSVELMVCENEVNAIKLGNKINSFNEDRKNIDGDITEEAMKLVQELELGPAKKSTVLYNPDWHKGVVGIVASRLIEHFYRPTVILTRSDNMATGSARSIDTYDLYRAVSACSDLLESFGGHKYAAGLSMPVENVDAFIERFENYVEETITDDQLKPQILIDQEITLNQISAKFFRILKQFEPFGPDNLTPVFIARNLRDTGRSRQVGRGWEHLKLSLVIESPGHGTMDAIAFNMGHFFNDIHKGKAFDLVFSVEENTYRGMSSIQLMVKDMKIHNT
ncbi:MAG: single-stranded-DNA-specific exonuclease RecJ [Bacteroidetes bacterium]|jgi:single-stranded-DNA-specific exonuclease|nr:single-stranded-DNA-specific exonuclease RecJ [Bacteroidota bacterium]MBT3751399.1 single-stranded-DNA-specific exonuclease RecJ [Bacteroidota bacterium]MBT4397900.1 single-stranded-DNA-specific exonuclease RecJ [Bacteroidota bacterium]MBT4411519.1 single-stranded-DNA-specific exonuclease RecJ [Bacteroidota bacterium]MBT5425904.1 single-stranded-DNA-specific exonuclease RecJ [Bacteroidota bacterium]